jgi:antitoxin HicB
MNMTPRFEEYRLEIRPIPEDEGSGFLACVVDLPGCMSDGDTYEEAIANVRDAFDAWISSATEAGNEIPAPGSEQRPAKFLLRLPRSTHQELVATGNLEGVSLNAFITILLTEALTYRRARREMLAEQAMPTTNAPWEYSVSDAGAVRGDMILRGDPVPPRGASQVGSVGGYWSGKMPNDSDTSVVQIESALRSRRGAPKKVR